MVARSDSAACASSGPDRMSAVRAFLCVCLVGCEFAHGSLQPIDGASGDDDAPRIDARIDAATDARPIDGPPGLCGGATPRLDETFTNTPACPLGVTGGAATMSL